jgi:hypothetical protein
MADRPTILNSAIFRSIHSLPQMRASYSWESRQERRSCVSPSLRPREALTQGFDDDEVIRRAKSAAAFGGQMRTNLIWMLDRIGLPGALGTASTETVFAADADLAVTTSAVCHAVLVHGENWDGRRPNILSHSLTRMFVEQVLAQELLWSPAALVIPLGVVPALAVERCVQTGAVHPTRVLMGLLHPSGANNGRIHGSEFHERLPELQRQVTAWRSLSSS